MMGECYKNFWRNSLKSLKVFQKFFENSTKTKFEWWDTVVDNMYFTPRCHRGPMRPLYYTHGLPSHTWVCSSCKNNVELVTDHPLGPGQGRCRPQQPPGPKASRVHPVDTP